MLRDSIQPFPTFSEVYIAALEGLHGQITTARGASEARPIPALIPSRRQDLLQPRRRPRKRRRQLTGGAQRVVANNLD